MSEQRHQEMQEAFQLSYQKFQETLLSNPSVMSIVDAIRIPPIEGDPGEITIHPMLSGDEFDFEVGITVHQTFCRDLEIDADDNVVFASQETTDGANNMYTEIWIGRRDITQPDSEFSLHPMFEETINELVETPFSVVEDSHAKFLADSCLDSWREAWKHFSSLGFVAFDKDSQDLVIIVNELPNVISSLDDLTMPFGTDPQLN